MEWCCCVWVTERTLHSSVSWKSHSVRYTLKLQWTDPSLTIYVWERVELFTDHWTTRWTLFQQQNALASYWEIHIRIIHSNHRPLGAMACRERSYDCYYSQKHTWRWNSSFYRDTGRNEQSTLLCRWPAPQYVHCVVRSILDDSTSHRYRFIHEGRRIWKGVEEWVMRSMRDWEGVLGCWSESGWFFGWMVVLCCVFHLKDECSWLVWLNGESMEWFVIVREGEWSGQIWKWEGGMSIECYVWSVRREELIEDEEEEEGGWWIWLEIIDGC